MQFFSHKIANPTGVTQTWDEYLESVLNKQASEAKPECNDDTRGQCRGQVINNDNEPEAHSYQEGESVDGKDDQAESGNHKPNKTEPKSAETKIADKAMGECDGAGKVTEDHSDAACEGDAKCEQNINNDPNYQKGESTNPGKVKDKSKKESSTKKSTKTSAKKTGFKKIACLNRKGKLQLFASMSTTKTKSGNAAWPIQYVEAMVGLTFANMKDDEKEWFKKFWQTQYPDSYVQEMVADR